MFNNIKNYFNYRKFIYIKVNFSQSDINELNVFKLLSISIQEKLQTLKKQFRSSLLVNILKFTLLYIIYGLIFYTPSIHRITSNYCEKTSYYKWFPSNDPNNYRILKNDIQDTQRVQLGRANVEFECLLKQVNFNAIDPITHKTKLFRKTVSSIDLVSQCTYMKIRIFLKENMDIKVNQFFKKYIIYSENNNFLIIPKYIDYYFWLGFFVMLLIIFIVKRLVYPFSIPYKVIKDLKDLNENIDAAIKEETFGSAGLVNLNLKYGKEKSYTKANIEFIERKLESIFEKINSSFFSHSALEFIIVFDEMDKLEGESHLSDDAGAYVKLSPSKAREKQKAIFDLLKGLKGFFTKVNAKFIFIAGKEMYDAALSDESDRDLKVSSLFDEVIYVESFLSNDDEKDITWSAEQFVCNLLIPDCYLENDSIKGNDDIKGENDRINKKSLSTYRKFLENYYIQQNKSPLSLTDKAEIDIIINNVKHFILFLTHTSNGVPKKMVTIFESFIEDIKTDTLNDKEHIYIKDPERITTYLVFSEKDQYIIGYYNYIISPINFYINNNSKKLGDKLLISISYLINHIFKYHKYGFSWRNLEISPEILDINKTPGLRQFMNDLIRYLTNIHINENINGLYNFKFYHSIANEISYLSKISDVDSAILNFSYDEALPIKLFYFEQLRQLKERYKQGYTDENSSKYVHSIARIILILADLSYYEEDYSNAITEYLEGIQYLRNTKDTFKINQLVLLTRNMLKLGLVYEKRKTNSSALLIYGEILTKILEFRDIKLEDFGFELKQYGDDKYISSKEKPWVAFSESEFNQNFFEHQAKEKFVHLNNVSAFENIKILYQPLLAHLYAIEKTSLEGVTKIDFSRLVKNFNYLTRTSNVESKSLMVADFWLRVGHLFFYKNSNLEIEKPLEVNCNLFDCEQSKTGERKNCDACKLYKYSLYNLLSNEPEFKEDHKNEDIFKRFIRSSIDVVLSNQANRCNKNVLILKAQAYSSLGNALLGCRKDISIDIYRLKTLIDLINDPNEKPKFINEIPDLNESEEIILMFYYSSYFYKSSGDLKSSVIQRTKILKFILKAINNYNSKIGEKEIEHILNKVNEIFLSPAIKDSYSIYSFTHVNEINKIKSCYITSEDSLWSDIDLSNIGIVEDICELALLFNELKLKLYSSQKEISYIKKINLFPTNSINNVINKIYAYRFRVLQNFYILKFFDLLPNKYDKPDSNLYFIDKILTFKADNSTYKFGDSEYAECTKTEIFEFCLCDSIYCLVEILNKINLYGTNYLVNHSFKASIHKKLAYWSYMYQVYLATYNLINKEKKSEKNWTDDKLFNKYIYKDFLNKLSANNKNVDTNKEMIDYAREVYNLIERINIYQSSETDIVGKLTDLIGEDNVHPVKENYQCEMAVRELYKIIATHNEGNSYREYTDSMYFLDSDYNDESFLFAIAFERFHLNRDNGKQSVIEAEIDRLKHRHKYSKIYDVDCYFNPTQVYG